jgi:hypothetical protein
VNFITIIGIFLSIVGFFGTLRFSAIFFGFFMAGLFLLIYTVIPKSKLSPTKLTGFSSSESTKRYTIPVSRFCPQCGAELDVNQDFCLFCGDKVRK